MGWCISGDMKRMKGNEIHKALVLLYDMLGMDGFFS